MPQKKTAIEKACELLGSQSRLSEIVGVSIPAVNRWVKRGRLPRTEWTGETCYAKQIEEATEGKVTQADLLENFSGK